MSVVHGESSKPTSATSSGTRTAELAAAPGARRPSSARWRRTARPGRIADSSSERAAAVAAFELEVGRGARASGRPARRAGACASRYPCSRSFAVSTRCGPVMHAIAIDPFRAGARSRLRRRAGCRRRPSRPRRPAGRRSTATTRMPRSSSGRSSTPAGTRPRSRRRPCARRRRRRRRTASVSTSSSELQSTEPVVLGAGDVLDAAHDGSEERVADVGDDRGPHLVHLAAQRARRPRRQVAEPVGRVAARAGPAPATPDPCRSARVTPSRATRRAARRRR